MLMVMMSRWRTAIASARGRLGKVWRAIPALCRNHTHSTVQVITNHHFLNLAWPIPQVDTGSKEAVKATL